MSNAFKLAASLAASLLCAACSSTPSDTTPDQGAELVPDSGMAGEFDTGASPRDSGSFDDSGGAGADMAVDETDVAMPTPDGGTRENPDVVLARELTFEQVDGTNGWSDPDSVVFNWQDHPTGRDRVPDFAVRGATGINPPDIDTEVAYRGARSAKFTMKPWSGSTFRTDMEMVGDLNAEPPVSRLFPQGETHVVGFAMRIEHANVVDTGGNSFQLYHQYHNGNPEKAGYGTTRNPAVSLLRDNDTDLKVAIRNNQPGGQRDLVSRTIPNGVRAGQWVRWVFKTRFANFDSGENGLVEVWSAVGDEPLTMHFRVDDVPVGYVYENPDHNYETIQFDCYGEPRQEEAATYLDEVRIAIGDVEPSVVDPLRWGSYQHPLNQPFDDDLAVNSQ